MTAYTTPPPDFRPVAAVAGCFIESDGHILYLKRAPDRPYSDTWCLPAGKLEPLEDPRAGVIREVFEETGLSIDAPDLQFLGTLYFREKGDYTFHIFRKSFASRPSPRLNHEHVAFQWTAPPITLNLIPGGPDAYQFYCEKRGSAANFSASKMRS